MKITIGSDHGAVQLKEEVKMVLKEYNDIEVTVLEIRGDQVKLGISAPKTVPIYRKEVYLQIQEETKEAMSVEGLDALKDLF